MAKIIIVMISRLRTDPPLFGDVRRASEKEKKKKNQQKNTLMLARRTDLWGYTPRIPPSALTSMLNFFFPCSLTRVTDFAKKEVMLVV